MRQGVRVGSNGGDTGVVRHQRLSSVRRLLGIGRADGRSAGSPGSQDRNWRRVPKINILPSNRATAPSTSQIRLVLLVVLLVEAFFIQQWYREVGNSFLQIEDTTGQLESVELQLADELQAVDKLRTQVSQLEAQRKVREDEFREVTGGQIDWHGVLGVLFAAETQGTRFRSVVTSPSGEVTVEGFATGPDALKTLPNQIASVADVLTLQSVETEPGSDPPTFIAVFQVRQ